MGSLVNRRRYSGGKKDERLLPYGYFELKYIENTSDAYIDTGVHFQEGDVPSIKTKASLTSWNSGNYNSYIIGGYSGSSTNAKGFSVGLRKNTGETRATIIGKTYSDYQDIVNSLGKIFTVDFNFPNGSYTNGTLITDEVGALLADMDYTIPLFVSNPIQYGMVETFLGRVYYVTIYNNGTLIRNFIPCLSPDNEVGMYDTVTKTFFKSPNGTAFVAGPKIYDGDDRDVPYDYEVEYLESSGTQWIDTGIVPICPSDTLYIKAKANQSTAAGVCGVLDGFGSNDIGVRLGWYAGYYGISTSNRVIYSQSQASINVVVEWLLSSQTRWCRSSKKEVRNDTVVSESVTYSGTARIFSTGGVGTYAKTNVSAQIYRYYHERNGIKLIDLIPVVKDGVGCMYDKVSGTFFYNQGTGDFIIGPRVIHCTDNDYYGIRWLATDAPDSPIIRIGNMDWHRTLPIHSKMRRCILGDDGSKRYVSDSDYTKDTDGNAIDYTVSSANGVTYDTAVEMWNHCFLTGTETIDDVDYHYIKLFPKLMIGNFVPTHYMGAFEAMLDRTNNKLYSTVKANIVYNNNGEVDGADLTYAENWRGGNNSSSYDSDSAKTLMGRAATYLTITNFCTYANNRGSYYGITNWAARNNLCRLYAVEYANFDSQATFNPELNAYGYHQGGLGFGVCNPALDAWNAYNGYNPVMPCGVTLKLGNKTGIVRYNLGATYSSGATAATYFDVPSYRGVENPFAHIWENVTGMYIHGSNSVNNIYVAEDGFHARTFPSTTSNTTPSGYKLRSSSLPLSNGWPVTLDWNDDGDFLAKTLDTTSAGTADNKSILRDYFWGQNANAKKLAVGGALLNSVQAGLFTIAVNGAVDHVYAHYGTRLLKVPYYNV